MSSASGKRRVLLIGLDSADADLIDAWMAEGHMPTFAALRSQGLWSRVGTTAEVMHVSGWPTLYTGTTPGHHGLYHAYQVRAGSQLIGRADPYRSGTDPFWKFLDAAGRRCIVFDAFMDHRLDGFNGIQILEYGTWTWFGDPCSTPGGMLGDIRRRFGAYPAPEHTEQVQVPDEPLRFRDQLIAGTQVKSRIVQALMREQDWDMFFVTFGEPHGAGHYLWHLGDPDYPTYAGNGGTHPVRDVYSAVDAAIGDILKAADDRTTVIITSTDGMGPNYSGCHLMPEMLHRMGLFHSGSVGEAQKSAAAPKKGLMSQVRNAIPLGVRQSITRCLPRSMRYKLSLNWMNTGIDWNRSKVFCVPNSNEGYFRINLQGREPLGNVAVDTEYQELLGALRHELTGLKNPVSGVRAAERITVMDEMYRGARREDLPDVVISWDAAARILSEIDTPSHGRIQKQAGHAISPFYTGNHRPNAFVLARGPGVKTGDVLDGGHVVDIAPTVLSMLGVDVPRHFEGKPWQNLL